ncbi:fermentation-respiration switch protein FrsA (DUF1100 family) [Nocardia transvalensis]|uniref:Fermentation-respiration switch protein FrsA (DUF1100 family) n=1 Tax=Nocardia transvalensis TaxID=37333 RepID=A0A7W9PLW0_9NOCA|nr:prolyl oligopeptidase family serine peptidase [Nocardia transvalensis]MBB5917873.1 fermentation-respiration switch protein FrsA (DUF1100 family) [Nocardia transvalensis]
MTRRNRWQVLGLVLLGVLTSAIGAAQEVSAEPACSVEVRSVALPVDGETATGRVYEPAGCGGDPGALVVAVHGHDGTSADFAEYLTALARRTASPVLIMDLRGPGSVWVPGEWNLLAGRDDILAATRWYRDGHPSITRTVLWGWSQGGITGGLAAAAAPPGLFDYWVDTFGPADDATAWLGADLAGPELRGQIEREAGGCTPVTCPQAYAERSPALLAGRLAVRRSFLVHGLADSLVPYSHGLELRAALTAAGKPVSTYTIASGRDLTGAVVPGDHSVGPAWFEGGCVVERLLTGTEPVGEGDRDYLVDVAHGVVTAPPAPRHAKCGA